MPKKRIYRIIPAAPNIYRVQYKSRWFWWMAQKYGYTDDYPISFSTVEDAKQWIGDELVRLAEVEKHLDQPPIYYP